MISKALFIFSPSLHPPSLPPSPPTFLLSLTLLPFSPPAPAPFYLQSLLDYLSSSDLTEMYWPALGTQHLISNIFVCSLILVLPQYNKRGT